MKYVKVKSSRDIVTLSDVPKVLFQLFEPAIKKGGVGVTLINDEGRALGTVLKINYFSNMYRVYLKKGNDGSGEYRYDDKQAKVLRLVIY